MKKWVAAKFVLCLLTEEQKHKHVNVSCDLQEELKNGSQFLTKVVTGDESWCSGYDPEPKQQSVSQSVEVTQFAWTKKARRIRSSVKTMLISFFDANGIAHKESVPPGQTVHQQFH